MKTFIAFLLALTFSSCLDTLLTPALSTGTITAYVHWGAEPIAGKKIELLPGGDTKFTDSTGRAVFRVDPGIFTVRAYGINRGGPVYISVDYNVYVRGGESVLVDVIDCIPCD